MKRITEEERKKRIEAVKALVPEASDTDVKKFLRLLGMDVSVAAHCLEKYYNKKK